MKLSALFKRFATAASRATGKPITFVLAALIVVVWGISGPIFHYSDTWQLVINTGTTIITFLMVFLIQNTQNRDSEAMHIKLDEMIRALDGAHNAMLDMEELDDEQLDEVRKRYRALAKKARADIEKGGRDIGCEDVDCADVSSSDSQDDAAARKSAKAKAHEAVSAFRNQS